MKVVHIESGLGNQMLSYAEYLVIKKMNPNDKCFIETIIYEIPECNEVISQWYGYELKRIFNIDVPNIKEEFTISQWENIIEDVKKTEFWNNGWRFAPAITNALNNQGMNLVNYWGDVERYRAEKNLKEKILDKKLIYDIKRWLRPLYVDKYRKAMDMSDKIFISTDENVFTGQTLGLKNYNANIDFIKEEIEQAFKFPPLKDNNNVFEANRIKSCNAVAIHARRGDMLQSNGYCYKYGYFKRAINYIKKNVSSPVFYFFCDTGSIEWCKQNLDIFGLLKDEDEIRFVDWNTDLNYYKDIQLMSYCKHNVITNSSFGWWGAYLNDNPDKITCSPNIWTNTTHHF